MIYQTSPIFVEWDRAIEELKAVHEAFKAGKVTIQEVLRVLDALEKVRDKIE